MANTTTTYRYYGLRPEIAALVDELAALTIRKPTNAIEWAVREKLNELKAGGQPAGAADPQRTPIE